MADGLLAIAEAEAACRRCGLYARATQVVPGSGAATASIVLVGEQPGDQEDRSGAPFVGPAGHVLDRALTASGLERDAVFLTNAVKHFKWEAGRGRRLHKKPTRAEVLACRPWLEAEIVEVDPRVIVALGATAGSSLLGPSFRVGRSRGVAMPLDVGVWRGHLVATLHPSAVLRAEEADRDVVFASLVGDLRVAAAAARGA